MLIEQRPIDSVKPYDNNPRINDGAVDAVVNSIKEFGFRQPIVVDADGVIVVGHTRWKAAKKMGLETVPVHVADLDPVRARAYRITDNQLASLATWNQQLLPLELKELEAAEFDMAMLGWSPDQLSDLLAPPPMDGLVDPDDTPEPAVTAITKPGDTWLLGRHRLRCGDSTNAADVDALMDGKKAALCATDPPYLVDYTGNRPDRDGGNSGGKDWSATYKEVAIKDAPGFFTGVFTNVLRVLEPHSAIYCWHAHKRQAVIDRVWEGLGILNHQQVIWVKPVAVFGRMFWHQRHEPCLMGWAKGSMPNYARDQGLEHGTVWEIDFEGKARIVGNQHPTQKPVEIFARPMRRHTKPGEVVYEPFSGSGSQIIAAEREGRTCCAMELEPVFVEVAVRRWEIFTGKKATRVGPDGAELPGLDAADAPAPGTAPAGAAPPPPRTTRTTRRTPDEKTPGRSGVKKGRAA